MIRPWLLLIALGLLFVAWFTPQHTFYAHMTAHMTVVAFAAPLLALGLAGGNWDPIKRWPRGGSPLVASLIELMVVWLWHMPLLHEAARQNAFARFAEQASFLASGFWLWLTIFGGDAAQRAERGALGIVALLLTLMHMTLLGALLALSPRPLYTGHHSAYTLQEQELGGVIMMGAGGLAYMAGALWLVGRLLYQSGGPGLGDSLILLARPTTDADSPHHFSVPLQRDSTSENHHTAVIARMNSEELVTGLAVLPKFPGLAIEGARSPRLVNRNVDASNPGSIHPDMSK